MTKPCVISNSASPASRGTPTIPGRRGDAPTGEPYIAFCSGGVKAEGAQAPCLCATKDVAVATWRLALLDYEAKNPGILYWREMPELIEVGKDEDGDVLYAVYSRLLISKKSPIRSARKTA